MKLGHSRVVRRLIGWAGLAGIDAHYIVTLRRLPRFFRERREYRRQATGSRFDLESGRLAPSLGDYDAPAGIARGHYFHQDLWAARRIFQQRPARHVDIGSRIDGFAAHVLAFMPLTIVDIRPMDSPVDGLTFLQGDATNMASVPTGSIESLSSLHAVEHIGLGRYCDRIDAEGWRQALDEFKRVLAPGGRLYLSVPIGRQRVEFNSHRVFAPRTIVEALSPLRLAAFHAVDDSDRLQMHADPDGYSGANFACGLFEFTKD